MRQISVHSNKSNSWWFVIWLTILALFLASQSQMTSANANHNVSEPSVDISESRLVAEPKPVQRPSTEVISEFFRTHPDNGVRGEFHRLLVDEQMSFVWSTFGASEASFGLVQEGDGSEPVLALLMDPELFLTRNRSRAQITVYHEYLHYMQWRDGTIPRDTFLLRDSIPPDEVHGWCKEKWHAEVLAYHEACAFGRANGLVHDLRPGGPLSLVCSVEERLFVPILKRVLTHADPASPVCSKTWDTI